MQSSWLQSNTIVANQARVLLTRLFTEGGEEMVLNASAPLLITEPDNVYFVETGSVDLFMVDVVNNRPQGRRTHFIRIQKGEIMLGFELLRTRLSDTSYGIVACGLPGTKVRVIHRDKVLKHAEILRVTEGLHGLLDQWVKRISLEVNEENIPRELVDVVPATQQELSPGVNFTAPKETVWIYHKSGKIKFAGVTELEPWSKVIFLPLVRGSWIETLSDCEIVTVSSEEYFKRDKNLISIRRFQRICLDSLARIRQNNFEAAALASMTRAKQEEVTVDTALASLSLFGSESEKQPFVLSSQERPLLAAVRLVCEACNIEFNISAMKTENPMLADVLTTAHIRSREVLLRSNWWTDDGSALVASEHETNNPIALIPRNGGYFLVNPAKKTTQKVTAELAQTIAPKAYELYRPFLPRALNGFDLVKFSLFGSGRDLMTIVLAGFVLGGIGMLMPFSMGLVIDNFIPNAKTSLLIQMGLALTIAAFANAMITVAQTLATIRIEIRSSTAIQAAVWDRILSLPVPFFREFGAGDLAHRAGGIDTIRRALSGGTINLLLSSGFSLLNFFLMLHYDSKLALVGLGLGLGSVTLAGVISFSTVYMRRELAKIEGDLSSLSLQLLTGIQKIRVAAAENRAFGQWAQLFGRKRSLEYRVGSIVNTFDVVSSIYPTFSTAVIFFMVVQSVRSGKLGAGDFLAFNAAFGIFLNGLLAIVGKAVELFDLLPVYERAKPILGAVPEVREGSEHPGELMGDIQISYLTFRYEKEGAPIIDNVDFSIRRGEFVALVGTTAAGKSTLMRLMLGFEKPESGGVYYDGKNLDTLDVSEVRRQMGVVLQNGSLVGNDIFENIVGNRDLTLDEAWEAAEAAGIADEIRAMPMKMHTVVLQGGMNFSGGQRQRLRIAQAIANKPRIVFFDEATSALDNKTQAIVSESLDKLHATRIVIAHRLSTIRNADKIIVLNKGRIVQQGTYDELMEQDGEFRTQAERQLV